MVPFVLPTDVFDGTHYFSARGLARAAKDSDSSLFAFAGTTSTWMGTGFFNAATSDNPVGILFYERQLSDRLRFFSATSPPTARPRCKAWSGNRTNGSRHRSPEESAPTRDISLPRSMREAKTFAFKASYVLMGDLFHRITIASPMSSEVDKGNVQMLYKRTHSSALRRVTRTSSNR